MFCGRLPNENKRGQERRASNLSKAHVTRDGSGPATLAISVDSVNLRDRNLDSLKCTFFAKNVIRRLSRSISSHFDAIHS